VLTCTLEINHRASDFEANTNTNKMCFVLSVREQDRPGNTLSKTVETIKIAW